MTPSLDELVITLQHFQLTLYADVASFCLWAYDYTLTLDLEIALMWAAPWSVPKALFLLTRYMPIIDSIPMVYFFAHPETSDGTCLAIFQLGQWMLIISVGLAEIILMIRTWAIWEGDHRLSIGLPIFFISVWSTLCVYGARYLGSLKFMPIKNPALSGCFVDARSSIQFVEWALIMGFEGGILILTFIKGYQTLRIGPRSGLMRLVYVDGILYYIALFALATMNLIAILTLPGAFANIFSFLQRIMHSVLTGRMLLQLRKYEHRHIRSEGLTEFNDVTMSLEFMQKTTTAVEDDPEGMYGTT